VLKQSQESCLTDFMGYWCSIPRAEKGRHNIFTTCCTKNHNHSRQSYFSRHQWSTESQYTQWFEYKYAETIQLI